jgi:hypothetical protein
VRSALEERKDVTSSSRSLAAAGASSRSLAAVAAVAALEEAEPSAMCVAAKSVRPRRGREEVRLSSGRRGARAGSAAHEGAEAEEVGRGKGLGLN